MTTARPLIVEGSGPPAEAADRPGFAVFLVLVVGLTALRLAGLGLSVVDLYVDESQYWSWSHEPAFGYFSKPPLIAWVIGLAELACGPSEACIRAPAPLFYLGTALLVYAVARELYSPRAAFWAGLTAALAPGVVFSARIITTDVPLLFFWALALLAYVRLLKGDGLWWAALLAVALGLGLLSKYAMVYFVPCALLAGLVDKRARALLRRPPLWLAFLGGGVLFLPNLAWNVGNGLSTMAATGDNIRGGGVVFDLANGLEFVAAQFAVGGPIVFAMLLVLASGMLRRVIASDDRVLLAFSLPVLALITVLAFVTEANANWAAPGFVAAFVVVPAILIRLDRIRLVQAGVAIGLFCQVALLVSDTVADRLTLPLVARGDVYARTLGWRALGERVDEAAERVGAAAIVADERGDVASLLYYAGEVGHPIYAWPARGAPRDHFELTRPLDAAAPEPILAVSACRRGERYRSQFATVERVGSFAAPTGPTSARRYHLFLLTGRIAPPAALSGCRGRGD